MILLMAALSGRDLTGKTCLYGLVASDLKNAIVNSYYMVLGKMLY